MTLDGKPEQQVIRVDYMSPSQWRAGGSEQRKIRKRESKGGQTVRNPGKDILAFSFHMGGQRVLSVYHDDPDITDADKLRTSGCITVPAEQEVEGEIGKMTIAGGAFAVAHFEITTDRYGEAWDMLMGQWMPESGYQPDDRLCYELYHNNPREHPEHKQVVDLCVPVKPL